MPDRMKLNHHSVSSATCPPGRKDMLLFDADLPGFGIRVTAGGAKIFLLQYASVAGKRRMAIGRFGVLTAEEARRKAKVLLGNVADKRDPFAERQALVASQAAQLAAAKR